MTNDSTALELSPKLPRTPGWTGLSEERKKWLTEENSELLKLGMAETHIGITSALKLRKIRAGLKGTSVTMESYLEYGFPGGIATGKRRLKGGDQLAELWGEDNCDIIVRKGETLLKGYLGVGLNEIVHIAKEVGPPPHSKDPKVLEAFFEKKVRPALADRREGRQEGQRKVKYATDAAQRMIFNSGRLYMRQAKNLNTSAETKDFIKTIVGWWMEDRGVPGTIECKRIQIPDGTIATVGRPRKKTSTKGK